MESLSWRLRSFPLSAYGDDEVALLLGPCAIHTRSTPIASDLALSAAYARVALEVEVATGFLWQLHSPLVAGRDVANVCFLSLFSFPFFSFLGVKGQLQSPR